jgi:hypothetical protein
MGNGMRVIGAAAVTLLVPLALLFGATTALGQAYPPPSGNCFIILSDPNPPTDSDVLFKIVISDVNGDPVPGVEGTAEIVSQPGSSAFISPTNFTTDTSGAAMLTLHTGDAPGPITILAKCGAVLSTQVTLPVGTPPGPPATGQGASSAGGGRSLHWGIAVLGVMALTAVISTTLAGRRWMERRGDHRR